MCVYIYIYIFIEMLCNQIPLLQNNNKISIHPNLLDSIKLKDLKKLFQPQTLKQNANPNTKTSSKPPV